MTNATHVLILANSGTTADAHAYAKEVMRNSSLLVLILDQDGFKKIKQSPAAIVSANQNQVTFGREDRSVRT